MDEARLRRIRLLAIDVDGTLTRGDVIYTESGDEMKVFNIADGLGITLCKHAGLLTAIVTGRESKAVERRARELEVPIICLGCRDKGEAIRKIRLDQGLAKEEVAFIGDDINDIPGFRESGVRIAVGNASSELRAEADIVTEQRGGEGAVREVIEMILRAQGKLTSAVEGYLEELERSKDKCRS